MKDTKTETFIVSFFTFDDAAQYFDQMIHQYENEGYELRDTSGITYVNCQYRVGLMFDKEIYPKDGIDV